MSDGNLFLNVFVVLPVHNRVRITEKFVKTLIAQHYPNYSMVLVDDGSLDQTAHVVKKLIPQVEVVQGDGNLWWGGGVKAGLERIGRLKPRPDDLVLIINDDTLMPATFLEVGVRVLRESERKMLLAIGKDEKTGRVVEHGSRIIWPTFRIVPAQNDGEINCAPTRGLMLKWKDYLEIGPFRSDVLPHYASDYEFTCRGIRKGFQIITHPEFYLTVNTETTGEEFIRAKSAREYLKKLFSIKSIRNPITVSKFVMLSAPKIFVLPALIKIWSGALYRFLMFVMGRVRHS